MQVAPWSWAGVPGSSHADNVLGQHSCQSVPILWIESSWHLKKIIFHILCCSMNPDFSGDRPLISKCTNLVLHTWKNFFSDSRQNQWVCCLKHQKRSGAWFKTKKGQVTSHSSPGVYLCLPSEWDEQTVFLCSPMHCVRHLIINVEPVFTVVASLTQSCLQTEARVQATFASRL